MELETAVRERGVCARCMHAWWHIILCYYSYMYIMNSFFNDNCARNSTCIIMMLCLFNASHDIAYIRHFEVERVNDLSGLVTRLFSSFQKLQMARKWAKR